MLVPYPQVTPTSNPVGPPGDRTGASAFPSDPRHPPNGLQQSRVLRRNLAGVGLESRSPPTLSSMRPTVDLCGSVRLMTCPDSIHLHLSAMGQARLSPPALGTVHVMYTCNHETKKQARQHPPLHFLFIPPPQVTSGSNHRIITCDDYLLITRIPSKS